MYTFPIKKEKRARLEKISDGGASRRKLYLEVETIVDAGEHGYASISEFVKDAVRRRLEEIAKLKETKSAR
jgi:hypothetical protein